MNFINKFVSQVNNDLDLNMRAGFLGTEESLVVYPLPGGQVIEEFFDGERTENLPFEIAMKSKDGAKINAVLWQLSDFINKLTNLDSEDFKLEKIEISNQPFINDYDTAGWFVFNLDFNAILTTRKED